MCKILCLKQYVNNICARRVRPMIEKLPLDKTAEGYARMMSGNAQYRVRAYEGLKTDSARRRKTCSASMIVALRS